MYPNLLCGTIHKSRAVICSINHKNVANISSKYARYIEKYAISIVIDQHIERNKLSYAFCKNLARNNDLHKYKKINGSRTKFAK